MISSFSNSRPITVRARRPSASAPQRTTIFEDDVDAPVVVVDIVVAVVVVLLLLLVVVHISPCAHTIALVIENTGVPKMPGPREGARAVIRFYGITEHGNSVLLKVHGFMYDAE